MSEEPVRSAALADLGLEAPLCRLSKPGVDEWAVRRMWEGIQKRQRAQAAGGGARWRVVALASLATLALSASLLAGGGLLPASRPALLQPLAGPLLTREAQPFASLEGPASSGARAAPARVDFADGSSIEAAPGARVEGLASTASEFVVSVRRGRAQFRVTPGGPRLWRIEARGARVEVVGTVLSVESDDTATNVQVDEGHVLVRSPQLPGGVQSVSAGQSLRLSLQPAPAPEVLAEPEPEPPVAAQPARPARAPRRSPPSAAELWEGADEARRSGQSARAAALLERLTRDYPDDSQVALAAFTLGVLQLDRLGQPAEAALSFQRALDLGIGKALREDVYPRWAEALERAGAPARIHAVLAEYERLYPLGRHRRAIAKRLSPPATPTGLP